MEENTMYDVEVTENEEVMDEQSSSGVFGYLMAIAGGAAAAVLTGKAIKKIKEKKADKKSKKSKSKDECKDIEDSEEESEE